MNTNNLMESFEEYYQVKLPTHKEVCWRCQGEGRHVNPAIDGNGITSDEWAEWDDDEREGYFSGRYDVSCEECHGASVLGVVDIDRLSPDLRRDWDDWVTSDQETEAMYAAERRMGA